MSVCNENKYFHYRILFVAFVIIIIVHTHSVHILLDAKHTNRRFVKFEVVHARTLHKRL